MTTSFYFQNDAVEPDTLRVIRIEGHETVSDLYRFRIDLIAEIDDLDLESILQQPATLTISRGDETLPVHGILESFEQHGQSQYATHYRAVLVPRLWLLTIRKQNQIYQDCRLLDIIEDELTNIGLSSADYEFRLQKTEYPIKEYIVQYNQTDLDFLHFHMEREGIFYFFEQTEEREKLVFADKPSHFQAIPDPATILYRTPAGMQTTDEDLVDQESVQALVCRHQRRPKKIVRTDFNYDRPSLDLRVEYPATETDPAEGMISEYGDHYPTPEEGRRYAKIRHEEQACRQQIFVGESDCVAFRAGATYNLDEHYRDDFANTYILTEVRHRGWQSAPGVDGVRVDPPDTEGPTIGYRNEFESMPASAPFRPERRTPAPRLHGIMNAKIDGATDGQYAEIDDQARYKIRTTFDLSGRGDGRASRFVRKGEPYAGQGYGMHTPLHKEIEVLWSCVDGDPNRPVIMCAVPNTETTSPVTRSNHTMSRLQTASNNFLELEDLMGSERITLSSPTASSLFSMGAGLAFETGFHWATDDHWTADVGGRRTENITSDTELNVLKGDYAQNVIEGQSATTVKKDISIDSKTESITISAEKTITLKTNNDKTSITLDSQGKITIQGLSIVIIGKEDVKASAPQVEATGSNTAKLGVGTQSVTCTQENLQTSGVEITQTAIGSHAITGAVVKIN